MPLWYVATVANSMVFLCVPTFLLCPLALLFFREMTDGVAFAIIVFFSLLFTAVMSVVPRVNSYHILLSAVAFVAVPVGVLAQLRN